MLLFFQEGKKRKGENTVQIKNLKIVQVNLNKYTGTTPNLPADRLSDWPPVFHKLDAGIRQAGHTAAELSSSHSQQIHVSHGLKECGRVFGRKRGTITIIQSGGANKVELENVWVSKYM